LILPAGKRKNKAHLDLISSGRRSLLVGRIDLVGEELLQESVRTGRDEIQDVLDQTVLVLVRHSRDVVEHLSSIVLDEELGTSRLEVGVGSERAQSLDEGVVGGGRVGVSSRGRVVESGEDTRRSLLLDELTDHLSKRNKEEGRR